MSMNATFLQVDQTELSRLQADPSLAEALFQNQSLAPLIALTEKMQERVRSVGPQLMADTLSRLPPELRQQLEGSIGRTMAAMSKGEGGADILKLMEQRRARAAGPASAARAVLSLDKEWHGVHYVLCGEVEPGAALLSQAVMGGVAIGDDDEGFSGYGPARSFTAAQVAELSQALSRPELESEAAGRFDAVRMSQLNVYPGWNPSDRDGVMDAFRRLRDFYADAARQGRAMVTCLV